MRSLQACASAHASEGWWCHISGHVTPTGTSHQRARHTSKHVTPAGTPGQRARHTSEHVTPASTPGQRTRHTSEHVTPAGTSGKRTRHTSEHVTPAGTPGKRTRHTSGHVTPASTSHQRARHGCASSMVSSHSHPTSTPRTAATTSMKPPCFSLPPRPSSELCALEEGVGGWAGRVGATPLDVVHGAVVHSELLCQLLAQSKPL
eukprot:143155-Chlamydomonas_euryale.AAC.5